MTDVEAVVLEHARRVVAGEARAREDLAPDAQVEPPDLIERLLAWQFRASDLVAHARIGAHHIVKTKYEGPMTVVVQARWVRNAAGQWQMVDAEIARMTRDSE